MASDLMIDFETLSTTPDAIVISVGACFFDVETKKIGSTFYAAFDVADQLKKGRSITADTLKWWFSQSDAAKKVFKEKADPPERVLKAFTEWAKANGTGINPWGNGATFDISIIEDLFRQYEVKCPWAFYNVMDLRTFKRFVANGAKVVVKGTAHNALDDAIAQAEYVIEHYGFFQEMIKAFQNIATQSQVST